MADIIKMKSHDVQANNDKNVGFITSTQDAVTTRIDAVGRWRHYFLLCAILVSPYLVNGGHAQVVCNVCTTLPAAFFTYVQLSDKATRIFAYKATLFYWSVHGIFIAADGVFIDTSGYFFAKFLLLVVLFFNVIVQHNSPLTGKDKRARDNSRAVSTTDSIMSTALSSTNSTQQWSNDDGISVRSRDSSMETAVSRTYSSGFDLHSDTGNESFNTVKQRSSSSSHPSSTKSPKSPDSVSTAYESVKERFVCRHYAARNSGDQSEDTLTSDNTQENTDNAAGLVLQPSFYITFNYPYDRTAHLYVTNKHDSAIMWVLKTNAYRILRGSPNGGVLKKGETVKVTISITNVLPRGIQIQNRVAIDYKFVDDSVTEVDEHFMTSDDPTHLRKQLRVLY